MIFIPAPAMLHAAAYSLFAFTSGVLARQPVIDLWDLMAGPPPPWDSPYARCDGCDATWIADGECDEVCNTESCSWDGGDCFHDRDGCFYDINGYDYRGTVSTTKSNHTCQLWSHQSPWSHHFTHGNYPSAGLGGHNYCRNPDGDAGPWCFVADSDDTRWDYCDVGTASDAQCARPPAQPPRTRPPPLQPPPPPPPPAPSEHVVRHGQCGEVEVIDIADGDAGWDVSLKVWLETWRPNTIVTLLYPKLETAPVCYGAGVIIVGATESYLQAAVRPAPQSRADHFYCQLKTRNLLQQNPGRDIQVTCADGPPVAPQPPPRPLPFGTPRLRLRHCHQHRIPGRRAPSLWVAGRSRALRVSPGWQLHGWYSRAMARHHSTSAVAGIAATQMYTARRMGLRSSRAAAATPFRLRP